jgi:hypothetical protein
MSTDTTTHALEIVQFAVTPGDEHALVAERDAMLAAVRSAHPGLLHARLVDLGDGNWMDLVTWRTLDEAQAAAADFPNIAAAASWAAHIAGVTSMSHGRIAHEA